MNRETRRVLLQRLKEPAKTLLLVLLAASAVFLAARTGLFNDLMKALTPAAPPPVAGAEELRPLSFQPAAKPLAAAVTGAYGLRHGVKYDLAGLDAVYGEFSGVLAEALGSAGMPEAVSDKTWRKALDSENVYFDYGTELRLDVLAAWLGTRRQDGGTYSASRLLLAEGADDSVDLYYMAGARAWRCRSMAVWSSMRTRMDDYFPNGAEFAYKTGKLKDNAPYALILEKLPALHSVRAAQGDREAALQAASVLFDVKLNSGADYTEADGTQVFRGDGGVLRLTAAGVLSYTAGENGVAVAAENEAERIEQARRCLTELHNAFARDETFRWAGERREEDAITVYFTCQVQAMPVYQDEETAWAVYRDGHLAELGLYLRTYQAGGKALSLPPELQSAAAAGSLRQGSEAALAYQDTGGERLYPTWVVLG